MLKFLQKEREYKSASDLKSAELHYALRKSLRDRRGSISIGVIDDSPFEPKRNLENVGYKITFIGDTNTIEISIPHQIILCDLQGVGRGLDPTKQGAFLIREIKSNFPDKYVIAYSGGGLNQAITRDAVQSSDGFVKKDADIDTWVEKLDEIIAKLLNPYQVWQRQRIALVQREVDTKTIIQLEDAFVRSLSQKDSSSESMFQSLVEGTEISKDVRVVLQSLISSGLFKLLFG